jgi:hypothetical protein
VPDARTSSLTAALSSQLVAARRSSSQVVTCDAGQLPSDGGLVWLAQADDRLGRSTAFAAQRRDWRRGPVRHRLVLLLRQRVLPIACGYDACGYDACGYEDQDEAATVRHDPRRKLVCGRRPHAPRADLASPPTRARLANAVDRRAGDRLALLGVYRQERERDGLPTHRRRDVDSTDDPTHGDQEGSRSHGSYRQHRSHPLLVFDGHTHQLITAVLRQGTVHARRGVGSILWRLVTAIRARWPHVRSERRADSGLAIPALSASC